ncbi:MAG: nuclear transport factor 2 family protein [Betaproteobacteria bacterium]|nr:nuclear transport factor 2 family protein [Betaproteobacteria bacterium]
MAVQLLDAWNARDLDSFVDLLAENIEWYDPAMPQPPARGRAAVRDFAETVLEAFPDFRYQVNGPICASPDQSRCVVVWRITATHTRPLRPLGYAPTGRSAEFEGVDVLDIRDGKVVRIYTAFDPIFAAGQLLGMQLRPVPGTWHARLAVLVQRFLALLARKLK